MTATVTQVGERESRRVVERKASCLAKRRFLVDDACSVEPVAHLENLCLGGRKDGVETNQDCHREDDISILSSNEEEIAKYVVGDTPDEPAIQFRSALSVTLSLLLFLREDPSAQFTGNPSHLLRFQPDTTLDVSSSSLAIAGPHAEDETGGHSAHDHLGSLYPVDVLKESFEKGFNSPSEKRVAFALAALGIEVNQ